MHGVTPDLIFNLLKAASIWWKTKNMLHELPINSKRLREDMEQIHFQYSNLLYEKIKLSKNHFHGKKSETIY